MTTLPELLAEAATVPVGAGGLLFLPYLAGERWPLHDPAARGAFVGLTLRHRRAHLVRAVLEAAAFALRHVAAPAVTAGLPFTELRVTGGTAASRLWNQVKADVVGVEVAVPRVAEASVAGAAILAARGIGLVEDELAGIEALVRSPSASSRTRRRRPSTIGWPPSTRTSTRGWPPSTPCSTTWRSRPAAERRNRIPDRRAGDRRAGVRRAAPSDGDPVSFASAGAAPARAASPPAPTPTDRRITRAQPAPVVAASHRPRRRAPRHRRTCRDRVRSAQRPERLADPDPGPIPTPSANPYTGVTEGSGTGVKLGYLSYGELVPYVFQISEGIRSRGGARRRGARRMRREARSDERLGLHEEAV